MSAGAGRAARLARSIAVAPIVVYQRLVSPAIPRRCKYEPTCSRYAVEAIGRFGILRGLVLAAWRLLRCNPWSYGGYDPVDAQRVFPLSIGPLGRRSAGAEQNGQPDDGAVTSPAARAPSTALP